MSFTEAANARSTPTLNSEMDRLLALVAQIESADAQITEIGNRLVGPRPMPEMPNNEKDPYGDLQRLQVIIDRLLYAQTRVADGINHVRGSLYGFDVGGLLGSSINAADGGDTAKYQRQRY